ncbi:MAG: DUF2993 domain-containing protein [Synechococcaceae cyanobacterium]
MTTPSDAGGPVLRLLSAALQLWLRQQCERLDSLDIQLEGTAASLMQGRLAGVRVLARGVRYQNLHLELVDLTSGPLRVQMGSLWRGQGVQLQEPFRIRGLVSFTAAGLNHSLAQPRWRALGDQLAEEMLGISPLVGLRLGDNRLVLAAQGVAEPRPVEVDTTIGVCSGGLELVTLDGSHRSLLPMDASLRVERASIEAGMLVLDGEATVTP